MHLIDRIRVFFFKEYSNPDPVNLKPDPQLCFNETTRKPMKYSNLLHNYYILKFLIAFLTPGAYFEFGLSSAYFKFGLSSAYFEFGLSRVKDSLLSLHSWRDDIIVNREVEWSRYRLAQG